MKVVVHHKNLTYLEDWLGMQEVGQLEPKPGLPPTTAHLGDLLARLAQDPAKVILRAAYNDPQASEWLSARAKIPAVMLPFTVGGTDKAKDLFGLYDDTLARLLAVSK
jgi:zinc/manganese transport system substrate-binding protein